MNRLRSQRLVPALGVSLALVTGASVALDASAGDAASRGTPLTGTLMFAPGAPAKVDGRPGYTGTYFRMILPGATDKYFSNPNSRATDKSYTLLRPGKEHGLELGKFQPPPTPAFTSSGSALASSVTLPESFVGINFSISTAPTDAQSNVKDNAPALFVNGSKVTGDMSAWTAEWNKIYFNQGAPKPGGTLPGETQPVTGTYDAKTQEVTITWYSAIVGGPFSGFTGYWHLEGKLEK